MNRKKEQKEIAVFLAITCILTLAINIPFRAYMDRNVAGNMGAGVMMFIPVLSMLLTRLITGEGFKNLWLKQYAEAGWRYYLMGWLAPIGIIAASALLYYLIFPGNFDLTMSQAPDSYSFMRVNLAVELVMGLLPFHLMFNIWFCLGEEWGWRGYLLPKLTSIYGPLPAVFISGIVWGLWHGPLTAIERINAGGGTADAWAGVGLYMFSCCAYSMLFSYITLRSGSCIPAAIAHAYHNTFAIFALLPNSAGVLEYVITFFVDGGYIVVGIFCLVKLQRLHKQGVLFPAVAEENP